VYPIVYFGALVVKVKESHQVRNKAADIAVGVDPDGIKHVLGAGAVVKLLWLPIRDIEDKNHDQDAQNARRVAPKARSITTGATVAMRRATWAQIGPNDFSAQSHGALTPPPQSLIARPGVHDTTRPPIGGQGVASSDPASPTNTLHAIRPSRTCIQPTFLQPSITPSGGAATSPIARVWCVISPRRCMRPPPIQRRGHDSRGPRR
jgi:hypothetical protein